MQIQHNQKGAVSTFSPLTEKFKANLAVNQPHCSAHSLALFALRDQSVIIESSLIDNAKAAIAQSQQLHFTHQVKESSLVIQAFLDKGIADVSKAQTLTNALKHGDCNLIEHTWNDFINDAMQTLLNTINAHTKDALKDVEGIDELLAEVNKEYAFYDLSIEQKNDSQPCDLVFKNNDFFSHVSTELYVVKDKALQYLYKNILDSTLKFGGIWQEDIVHLGFMEQWSSAEEDVINAVDALLVELTSAPAEQVNALLEQYRASAQHESLIGVIDEIEELAFCGEENEPDEYKEWLLNEVTEQIDINRKTNQLNDISKQSLSFDDCYTNKVSKQLKALQKSVNTHLNSDTIPESFTLDEDNYSHLTFVLKNSDENCVLDKISQEQFEQFCHADEGDEIYRIDLNCESWLEDLQEMTLALTTTFVAITAITNSLIDNRFVAR